MSGGGSTPQPVPVPTPPSAEEIGVVADALWTAHRTDFVNEVIAHWS